MGKCHGGKLSSGVGSCPCRELSWWGIVLEGSCPGGESSEWELSSGGVIQEPAHT